MVLAVTEPTKWLTVNETAKILGVSGMTLYRAINAGAFPAVRIGQRICVPAAALEKLADIAIENSTVIDAADWRKVLMGE